MPHPSENEILAPLRQSVLQSLERHRPGSYWPRALRIAPAFCNDSLETHRAAELGIIALSSLLVLAIGVVVGFLPHSEMTVERLLRFCLSGVIGSLTGRVISLTLRRSRPIGRGSWLKVNAWLETRPEWLPIVARWVAASHDELIGRDAHALARAVRRDEDAAPKAAAMAALLEAGFALSTARVLSHRWWRARATAFATGRAQAAQRRAEERSRTRQAFQQGPVAAALEAHRLNELLPQTQASGTRERL